MGLYKKLVKLISKKKALPKEVVEEALKHPNGWVYKIVGKYSMKDDVPSEAIEGAWKVNENGVVIGDFIPNPNFKQPK